MSACPWLISSMVASPFELTKAAQAWELELLHSIRAVIKLLEQFNLAQDCHESNTSFRKFRSLESFQIDIRGWRLVGLKKTLPDAKAQTALAGSSQLSCNARAICLTAKKLGGMVLHCTLAFLRGLKSKFLQLPRAVETMLCWGWHGLPTIG